MCSYFLGRPWHQYTATHNFMRAAVLRHMTALDEKMNGWIRKEFVTTFSSARARAQGASPSALGNSATCSLCTHSSMYSRPDAFFAHRSMAVEARSLMSLLPNTANAFSNTCECQTSHKQSESSPIHSNIGEKLKNQHDFYIFLKQWRCDLYHDGSCPCR